MGLYMGCIYTSILIAYMYVMRGSGKFCQRGSNYDKVFFSFMRGGGGRIQIPLLAGHQRPACETPFNAFRWRADDSNMECWLGSFLIFQGISTSIAKEPYIFVIFQGRGGGGPLAPPLDPHMYVFAKSSLNTRTDVSSGGPLCLCFRLSLSASILRACEQRMLSRFSKCIRRLVPRARPSPHPHPTPLIDAIYVKS